MLVDDRAAFVMLLTEPFFDTFTDKARCDTTSHCEGLFAVSCTDREEVDALAEQAVDSGAVLVLTQRRS
jgi:predicted lactoylglutathione lyase